MIIYKIKYEGLTTVISGYPIVKLEELTAQTSGGLRGVNINSPLYTRNV